MIEQVKVIDFGSAVIRDLRKPPPMHTSFFGTLTFASPGKSSGTYA
jgi:serine/threonine protein kinase